MASQRSRRPTAWEVSFPGESSEDESKDEEVELEPERKEEEVAILNGKRKTSSIKDERVRCVSPYLLSFSWLTCAWNVIASEAPQSGATAAIPGRWGRETG